jgi:hypothetical protein
MATALATGEDELVRSAHPALNARHMVDRVIDTATKIRGTGTRPLYADAALEG